MRKLYLIFLLLWAVPTLAQYRSVNVPFGTNINFQTGNANTLFNLTLTGNVISSTLDTGTSGVNVVFNICQDATGNRTFVWPLNFTGAPTITATALACTSAQFIVANTNSVTNISGGTVTNAAIIAANGVVTNPTSIQTIQPNAQTTVPLALKDFNASQGDLLQFINSTGSVVGHINLSEANGILSIQTGN